MRTAEELRAARQTAQRALHKATHEAREEAEAERLRLSGFRRRRDHWRGVAEGLARLILKITPAGASE